MARRMMCAAALCLVLGCVGDKYRYAKDYAIETFAGQFRCDASNVQAQQVENGWAVSGCGSNATCDVVRGTWGCQPAVAQAGAPGEAPHLRAWNVVLAQSRCPRERVIPTRQSNLVPGETLVQLDACGTPWSCRVAPGGVSCQPANGAAVAATPDQPAPVPPPPPNASGRPPPPTAAPTLSDGATVGGAAPPPPPGTGRPPPPMATPAPSTGAQPPPPAGRPGAQPPPPTTVVAPQPGSNRPPPPAGAQPPPPAATGAMTPVPWPGAHEAAPVAAPAAEEECIPKCRSGFVCKAGTCVAGCNPACGSGMLCYRGYCISACNPPCEAGEQCTDQGECVRQ